jgi:hypothetical protein
MLYLIASTIVFGIPYAVNPYSGYQCSGRHCSAFTVSTTMFRPSRAKVWAIAWLMLIS